MSVLEINELRRKRAKAIHEARSIAENAEMNGRDLNEEEEKRYNAYIDESNRLLKQIKRAEELRELQMGLNDPAEPAQRPDPAETRSQYSKRTVPNDPASSEEYRDAFWAYVRKDKGALDVPEARALAEGTSTAGGYLVPTEFERTLIQKLNSVNVMRRLATVIRTAGDRQIPVVSSHGQAYWTGEGAAYTESDETFGQKILKAYKAATLMRISDELLQDSAFNLDDYVANEFTRRINELIESAYVNGDGVNKPKGFLQDADLYGGADIPGTMTADNVLDIYYSLRRPYRSNATWVMHDTTVKVIAQIKDTTNQYIWQPGLQPGEPDKIKGRPVEVSDFMPTKATGNRFIAFGDFSYYWIADRQGISLQRLNERYAELGQVGFKGSLRTDGVLTLTEAIKCAKSA